MREPTPLSDEYLSTVGAILRKLARHFQRQLDEAAQLTYMEHLRDIPLNKLELACDSAIKKLKKMPLVADLRELANEKSEDALYRGSEEPERLNYIAKKPILDIIRPIAREISVELTGREYDSLDANDPEDNKLIRYVFFEANTIRYIRMGRCGKWLKPTQKQQEIADRRTFTDWANI
jgi:hypothetical protein